MASMIEKLVIGLGMNVDRASFSSAQGALKNLTGQMQSFGGAAGAAIGMMAGSRALSAMTDQMQNIIKAGAGMEQTAMSFEVLLGSKEKADAMIKSLQIMGKETPFTTNQLLEQTQIMAAYGVEQKKLLPTMRMLGDVSGGNAEKLGRLAYAYAQIQTAGKLQGQDLLQLVNAGFNPLQEIAKKTGKTMPQLKKEMEKGAISAKMVEQAFIDATSAGGRFFEFMKKGSQTSAGLWSNIVEVFEQFQVVAGTALLEKIKPALTWFKNWIEKNSDQIKELAPLYGVVLAGGILLAAGAMAILGIAAIGALAPLVVAGLAVVAVFAKVVFIVGLVVGAIAGLTYLVYEFGESVGKALGDFFTGIFDAILNQFIKLKSFVESIASWMGFYGSKAGFKFTGQGAGNMADIVSPRSSQSVGASKTVSVGNITINAQNADAGQVYKQFTDRMANDFNLMLGTE